MTDHIQRFNLDPNHSGLGFYNGLTSSDEGSLVGFDDYAAAIARAEKAEAWLSLAIEGLVRAEAEIDVYIRQEYPYDHPVHEHYRKRDYAANSARIALSALTDQE
jgi:hypothetical protein